MNPNNKYKESHYKLIGPGRLQIEMLMKCLDDLLPSDHRARDVWKFVEKLDISSCLDEIYSFKDAAGRPTTSPKILLSLWIYSILDGNVSARKIEELCKYHDAYKWIAGNAPINRTMLSDFRSSNPAKFDDLLTSCLAVMVESGLIYDEDFSQDGTRCRASAGTDTFRRENTLKTKKYEATCYLKKLQEELIANPNAYDDRKKAAKTRAANEKLERVDMALKKLEEYRVAKIVTAKKNKRSVTQKDLKDIRVSTTDPEARVMKMAHSGFQPAFNVQFATGNISKVIFGVDVINTMDPGTSPNMMKKVHLTLETLDLARAKSWNVDSAYSSKEDIDHAAEFFPWCDYNAAPRTRNGKDPKASGKNDSLAVEIWRGRLGTDEMKENYKFRCCTAEFSNAQTKNQGMGEFLVRGIENVGAMVTLHAIAHNFYRYLDLMSKKLTNRLI